MLEIRNISLTFYKNTENENPLFNGLSLTIEPHKNTALLGPNGCGKSTLMNLIAGSLMPDNGSILLNETDITSKNDVQRAGFIGRVYQDPSAGVAPSLTILENLSLANKKGGSFQLKKLIRKEKRQEFISLLKELDLGLENKLDTPVKFLSGGQRQSLSLLMATMNNPSLLLLDEHTAALDPKTSKVIMDKTRDYLHRHRMTTLMISHNMRDAIAYSDRIIMLAQGKIILDCKSEQMTENELLHIYNDMLTKLEE